ncbi:MAG: hypothetical protein L6R19_25690 [Alphaproteobacteria bacterium]|nr:hypothetical protein [Alphaproteobacteria bacterium]
MARLGRYFLPDQPLHVIQRGNNRGVIFFAPGDYAQYRAWLAEAAAQYGLQVRKRGQSGFSPPRLIGLQHRTCRRRRWPGSAAISCPTSRCT